MDNFAGGRHVTLLNKCRVRRCLIQCQSKVTSISQSIVLHRYLYMYFPRRSKDWIHIKPNFYIWATYFLCLSLTWSIPVGISVRWSVPIIFQKRRFNGIVKLKRGPVWDLWNPDRATYFTVSHLRSKNKWHDNSIIMTHWCYSAMVMVRWLEKLILQWYEAEDAIVRCEAFLRHHYRDIAP